MAVRFDRRRFVAASLSSAVGSTLAAVQGHCAPGTAEKITPTRLDVDFECGGGKRLRQLAPDHWRVEASGDASGYDKYFCVRITPASSPSASKVRLDIYPDSELGERGRSYFESHFRRTSGIASTAGPAGRPGTPRS